MATLKNLLERMNRFVREVANSDMPYGEKKRIGWQLLRDAQALYPSLDFYSQRDLSGYVANLRRTLRRWTEKEILEVKEKLAWAAKSFEALKYLGGTGQTEAQRLEIERLTGILRELEASLPELLEEPGVKGAGSTPPELQAAESLRTQMEQRGFTDEASLRDAIAKTQAQINSLESYRSTLDPNRDALWGKQAFDEIRALGEFIQEWNCQLEHLKLREGEARTSRWQEDKAKEETRRYVASVETALAEGKEQIQAIKALHDALGEVDRAFSLCKMVISKALVQLRPGVIPTGEVDSIIDRFERLLAGIRDRLPEPEVRNAARKLERLKAYRAEMSTAVNRLGYQEEVSAYEARQKSEGVTYFRSNLPSIVREILPARDISGLEKLASTGVNGAKKAISIAIFIAGKRNPERMSAILGG